LKFLGNRPSTTPSGAADLIAKTNKQANLVDAISGPPRVSQ
jgi:hypothetical protein